MRTAEIKVLKYEELDGNAKNRAREWLTNYDRFDYIFSEASDSLKAFEKVMPFRYNQVDFLEPYRNEIRYQIDDDAEELTGLRLRTYIINNYGNVLYKRKYLKHLGTDRQAPLVHPMIKTSKNAGLYYHTGYSRIQLQTKNCNLTGVCYDESLLAPLYKFIEKPNDRDTLRDLIEEGINTLCKDIQSEIEANCKEEALIEHCEANGYEFYEDGTIF